MNVLISIYIIIIFFSFSLQKFENFFTNPIIPPLYSETNVINGQIF